MSLGEEMKEAVLTKNLNIPLDSIIKTYYNPKYVFVPIHENDMLKVKDNTYVYKNSEVLIRNNGVKVCSPISGVVLGVRDMYYASGCYPSVVIENDFKEIDDSLNTIVNYSTKIINNYIDYLCKNCLIFKSHLRMTCICIVSN